ncbi:MAG: TonB C-terminal domain-containing protein [Proteobacteria bacterium]|nr:TonB C-terminal domain-containing protein [Pseudomonadota bacterium]
MAAIIQSKQESFTGDGQLLKLFIGFSIFIHITVAAVLFFDPFKLPKPQFDEWSIDTELLSDQEMGSAPTTVIPNAQKSEDVSVPTNQLPQLTKTFTIKEKLKEDEGIAPPTPEEKKELGKNTTPDTEKNGQSVIKPDAAVKLKKNEALERLVREKLKEKQKEISNELKAQNNSEIAQIRDILKDSGVTQKVGGIAGIAENNRYKGYLLGILKRNYAMPKTYQLSQANLEATLAVTINVRGELMKVSVDTGSGDTVFDEYCMQTVQKSSPFNPPPKELAGEIITIKCKP